MGLILAVASGFGVRDQRLQKMIVVAGLALGNHGVYLIFSDALAAGRLAKSAHEREGIAVEANKIQDNFLISQDLHNSFLVLI